MWPTAVTAIVSFNRHIGLVAKSSSFLLNFIFMIFDKKVKSDKTKSYGFVLAWQQFKLKSSIDTSQAYLNNTQTRWIKKNEVV